MTSDRPGEPPGPRSGVVGHALGALLRELDEAAPGELVEACAGWLRRHLAARSCLVLLADYGETSLEPVPDLVPGTTCCVASHDMGTSPAGRAYREQRRIVEYPDGSRGDAGEVDAGQVVVHVPVSIRTERLGVLVVTLPAAGSGALEVVENVAQMLAYLLTDARRYTDRFEILRRRRDLGLAAEIQWELLPSLAYELPGFSIAGALEPAYDIGGDTFDYAVSAHQLSVTICDAVGHGVRAALLASLAVTAMRNARRARLPLVDQAAAADRQLVEQFSGPRFVTGLLLQVDVTTGIGVLINAGHPPPLLLRDGAVSTMSPPPDPPLGLFGDTGYRLHPLELRSGDRLLLITDGITEAHVRHGPEFGDARVTELLTAGRHPSPSEFVRALTRAVLTFRGGELSDDATAVCLDWRPAARPRLPEPRR